MVSWTNPPPPRPPALLLFCCDGPIPYMLGDCIDFLVVRVCVADVVNSSRPEDIFGSIQVDSKGNIEGGFQPSGTYRILTNEGM